MQFVFLIFYNTKVYRFEKEVFIPAHVCINNEPLANYNETSRFGKIYKFNSEPDIYSYYS